MLYILEDDWLPAAAVTHPCMLPSLFLHMQSVLSCTKLSLHMLARCWAWRCAIAACSAGCSAASSSRPPEHASIVLACYAVGHVLQLLGLVSSTCIGQVLSWQCADGCVCWWQAAAITVCMPCRRPCPAPTGSCLQHMHRSGGGIWMCADGWCRHWLPAAAFNLCMRLSHHRRANGVVLHLLVSSTCMVRCLRRGATSVCAGDVQPTQASWTSRPAAQRLCILGCALASGTASAWCAGQQLCGS